MKFREFLTSKIHGAAVVKVIWPERGKRATGHPADYKNENSMLNANVFDFMVCPDDSDANIIVWLTGSDFTMI